MIEKQLINLLLEKDFYEENKGRVSKSMFTNGTGKLYETITKAHSDSESNISIDELYVHTNYFSDGEVWSNSWFTWSAVGKTTGEEYTNRAHFVYKWENGKIVELLAYYSEYADLKESAALQATQE